MAELAYIKVFLDWTESTRRLKDAEKGRLIDALVTYAKGGDPDLILTGNEQYAFETFRLQIDRDAEELENTRELRSRAGRKGNEKRWNDSSGLSHCDVCDNCESQKSQCDSEHRKNRKDKEEDKDKDKDKDKDTRNEYIARVFEMLNQRTGKHFRATGQSRAHVNARFSEGYTLEDFEAVIDKKCAEWLGGDMEKYLRPETLFGSKFDGYLNEPVKRRKSGGGSSWSFEDLAAEPQEEENRVYVEPDDTEGGFPF